MMGYVKRDYHQSIARGMSERQLQKNVIELAQVLGYTLVYHTWNSLHSPKGWPDLVLCKPSEERIIYIELKSEKGKLTPAQTEWLDGIHACRQETHIFRPSDWISGRIEYVLQHKLWKLLDAFVLPQDSSATPKVGRMSWDVDALAKAGIIIDKDIG